MNRSFATTSLTISLTLALALLATVLAAPAARADIVYFTSGGTLEGTLLQEMDDRVFFKVGSNTMTLSRDMIVRIESLPTPMDEYRKRLATLTDTAEAQAELGRWARSKSLAEESREHFWRAITLDPDNLVARQALGFVRVNDQWLLREEARKVDPAIDEQFVARRTAWLKKFDAMNRSCFNGWFLDNEAQAARQEIVAIKDPAAIQPLIQVFGSTKDPLKREMAAEALGNVGGERAALALVDLVVRETDDDVAAKARRSLAGIKSPRAIRQMNMVLRGGLNDARNRVAPLLADAGVRDAIPGLINSLVTLTTYTVHHEPIESQRAWIATGTQETYVSQVEPVVAEAAVGFRATTSVIQSGAVLDVKAQVQPWQERVTLLVHNGQVLDSLRRLTGQDFGYNMQAWRVWYYAQKAGQRAASPAGAEASPLPAPGAETPVTP